VTAARWSNAILFPKGSQPDSPSDKGKVQASACHTGTNLKVGHLCDRPSCSFVDVIYFLFVLFSSGGLLSVTCWFYHADEGLRLHSWWRRPRETDRQTETHKDRQRQTELDRDRDRQTDRQTDSVRERTTEKYTETDRLRQRKREKDLIINRFCF